MDYREIFYSIFTLLFIFIVCYQTLRIVFLRYFKNFDKTVEKNLELEGYKIFELRDIYEEERKNNPFGIKDYTLMSFIISKMPYSSLYLWNKQDYKIALAINNENKEFTIWIEINTMYFYKPVIKFITQRIRSSRNTVYNEEKNTISNCPACGFAVGNEDSICHDCGLHFE